MNFVHKTSYALVLSTATFVVPNNGQNNNLTLPAGPALNYVKITIQAGAYAEINAQTLYI